MVLSFIHKFQIKFHTILTRYNNKNIILSKKHVKSNLNRGNNNAVSLYPYYMELFDE